MIFATRQLYTTVLWQLKRGDDDQPLLEKLHEMHDTSSVITCVDVNPIIKAEVCQLRRKDHFTIARNR